MKRQLGLVKRVLPNSWDIKWQLLIQDNITPSRFWGYNFSGKHRFSPIAVIVPSFYAVQFLASESYIEKENYEGLIEIIT